MWLTTQNHSTLVTERSAVPFLPVNPEYSATRNQVKHAHMLIHTPPPYTSGNHRWRAYAHARLFCRFFPLLQWQKKKWRKRKNSKNREWILVMLKEAECQWEIDKGCSSAVEEERRCNPSVPHVRSHTFSSCVVIGRHCHVCSPLIGQYTVNSNFSLFIIMYRKKKHTISWTFYLCMYFSELFQMAFCCI